MFDRRKLLTTTATAVVTGAVTLATAPVTLAAPKTTPEKQPEYDWLAWLAANRATVGVSIDDGRGRRLTHRAHAPQLIASSIKIVHLAAYATAVAEGRLDPAEPIRMGDWDAHHPYVSDGRAHYSALNHLGVPCDEFGIARNPDQTVPLDQLALAMMRFSDNAATDYLRVRLGDAALHRAAANGGWRRPDVRSYQGEVLQLMFPEHAVAGPPDARRRAGDRIAARFRRDLDFRAEAFARIATMPATEEAQWPWIRGHGKCSAAELAGLHRSIATGRFLPHDALPVIRRHFEATLDGLKPEGAIAIGFKGGSLPRTLTIGITVRWEDGHVGSLAVLLLGAGPQQQAEALGLIELAIGSLSDPARLESLARALKD